MVRMMHRATAARTLDRTGVSPPLMLSRSKLALRARQAATRSQAWYTPFDTAQGERRRAGARSILSIFSLIWLLGPFAACSQPSPSPEHQIRALIAKGEKAAEEKDLQTLKSLLSETYKDEDGNRKAEVVKILAFHLMRNESIHLLTRIRAIELPDPKHASATVFVAMAGGKLGSIDDLLRYRADLYRVELTAADEGRADWKVTSATWRPAETSDFE